VRQGGKVDKEEESSTIQTYEDLIIENFGSETPSFYDGFTVKY